jgi:ATP-dependent Lhr-like helicase
MIETLYPGATIRPDPQLPPDLRAETTQDAALVEMLRGHMDCLGTQGVDDLVRRTGMTSGRVASGMAQLEGEGIVLRGYFHGDDREEFCDRRLLARIHRYTLDRLRREIEPVTAQDLLRFLLRWQHVGENTQLEGKRGLLEAVAQLQGFEAPVLAWERHILPARVAHYKQSWLDDLCLSGDVTWARLSVKKPTTNGQTNGVSTSSSSLISLAQRGDVPWLMAGMRNGATPDVPERGAAHDVLELLNERGALFYDDIVRGLVTADGFQALRSLMSAGRRVPLRQRQKGNKRFKSLSAGVPAGRWSALPGGDEASQPASPSGDKSAQPALPGGGNALDMEELAEAWAEQLLFRYGVVFRDIMQRESMSIPWREVLRALRRMEARGTIRGGRFVAGFYGEQYARPEAIEMLRRARRIDRVEEETHVSAVDPLNLAGILTPGAKIPAVHTNLVLYKDGLPSLAGDAVG